jgi:topoisomerase-4 subunit A
LTGPDFPTGGLILNAQGIKDAYKTGQGKIILRGEIEKVSANKLQIKSLPYDVSIKAFLRKMDDIIEENTIGIKDCLDKSKQITKSGSYRVDIEITTNYGANFELIKNYLCKTTDLQISFNFNQMAIVDNKPMMCSLLLTLDKIIEHQNNVLIRAYTFDLKKSEIRKEIVEGLLKATEKQNVLDEIIKLIRSSKTKVEAKESLIKKYKFTELQVDAILALRLSQLVNTDIIALRNELDELVIKIAEYKKIINDKEYRAEVLANKLKQYQKQFNLPRKSTIVQNDTGEITIDEQATIVDEDKIIAVTKQGFIKSVSKASFVKSD